MTSVPEKKSVLAAVTIVKLPWFYNVKLTSGIVLLIISSCYFSVQLHYKSRVIVHYLVQGSEMCVVGGVELCIGGWRVG